MLICDACNKGFHLQCMGLQAEPASLQWLCKGCDLHWTKSANDQRPEPERRYFIDKILSWRFEGDQVRVKCSTLCNYDPDIYDWDELPWAVRNEAKKIEPKVMALTAQKVCVQKAIKYLPELVRELLPDALL